MQVRRRGRDGAAGRPRPDDAQGRACARLPRDRRRPTRPTTCAASTTATATIDGVAADSTTETYAALRLEIDNWRWSGVPFFIRTGKCLPVTQTEVRLVFKRAAAARLRAPRRAAPGADQLVRQARPDDRRPAARSTPSAPTRPEPRADHPRHGVRRGGRRGRRRPYEVLLHAAMQRRQRRASPARTASRRRGGSCSRCSTRRRRCTRTSRGSWGPAAARPACVAGARSAGTSPWVAVMTRRADGGRRAGRAAERRRAVAVPADRRLRLPLRLPHRRAGRAGRLDRLAVRARASTRRASSAALLDREAGSFRFGPCGIDVPTSARATCRARTCSRRPGRRRPAGSSSATR